MSRWMNDKTRHDRIKNYTIRERMNVACIVENKLMYVFWTCTKNTYKCRSKKNKSNIY